VGLVSIFYCLRFEISFFVEEEEEGEEEESLPSKFLSF
jgi:hypothetical protein